MSRCTWTTGLPTVFPAYMTSTKRWKEGMDDWRFAGCGTASEVERLQRRHDWPALGSLTAVERECHLPDRCERERHYFLSSHPGHCAQRLGTLIRNYSSAEIQLHWPSWVGRCPSLAPPQTSLVAHRICPMRAATTYPGGTAGCVSRLLLCDSMGAVCPDWLVQEVRPDGHLTGSCVMPQGTLYSFRRSS
jgi:hypothetical protein